MYIGAELNDNEQTEVFKQNKTPLITNNVMHNCYGFPDIHFEQKNIASHCIEGEMLFKLYEMLLFLSNTTSSGNMCTLQLQLHH